MRNKFMLGAMALALTISTANVTSAQDALPRLDPIAFAAALIERGDAAEACALLNVVYGAGTDNPEALFLFGRCHMLQGKTTEAVAYLESALRRQPSALAVRATLAGLYIRLGREDEARALLASARQSNPRSAPAESLARLADEPVLAHRVAAAAGRPWQAEIALARIYDSNSNGGSTASTVDVVIGGVPLTFNISPSSQAKPDWGTRISASGSYLHRLDAHYGIVMRGNASATFYDNERQQNRQNIGAGIGLVYRDARTAWSVVPNIRYSWLDGNADEFVTAIDGRINHKLTPQLSLTGSGQVGYASVPSDHMRDNWIGLAAIGLDYAFTPTISGGVQLMARRAAGELATEAYTGIGPEIYLSAALTDNLKVDASYSYMHAKFDGSLGIFPQGRSDDRHNIGVALNLDLSDLQPGLGAFARYDYTNTNSTIGFHTSDRHLISAGLKYRF